MISTMQTCENCGETRTLARRGPREVENPETGGWRTLNSGSLEATFCNNCVRAVVVAAREAAEARGQ